SCSSSQTPEEQLYNCWKQSFNNEGVDIEKSLKDFELDLIKNGYLKDTTWSSYQHLFDSMSCVNKPYLGRSISLEKFLKASFPVTKNCGSLNLIDKIPKLAELTKKIEKTTQTKKDNFTEIYTIFNESIDKHDFQKKLYKTFVSWFLVSNSVYGNSLKEMLPQNNNRADFEILIDKEGMYFYNDKRVDYDRIVEIINKIKEADKVVTIKLSIDKTIPTSKLVDLMNMCRSDKIKLKLNSE
ncbi:MAG TPA: hypothetical protein VJ937_12125, partial [Salinivirga sp.]|uniref:ExbD/TolR family protein n=1 Tax=Salinivirga sp. TaxID=1970192 RepID=UPI002B48C18F